MDKFINASYILRILDHPFGIVELIARSTVIVTAIVLFILSLINLDKSFSLSIIALSLLIFSIHLILKKFKPHQFHPPKIVSMRPPVAELVRANPIYIFLASFYLAIIFITFITGDQITNIILYENLFLQNMLTAFMIMASITFLLLLLPYVPFLIKSIKTRSFSSNIYSFLFNEIIVFISLIFTFVYILLNSISLLDSFVNFGKILFGSISILLIKDIFIGKKTHKVVDGE